MTAATLVRGGGAKPDAAPPGRRSRQGRVAALYLAPGMIGFIAFIVIPLVFSLLISFFAWPQFGDPEFVGAANYVTMLTTDPVFWVVMRNTVIFAVGYTALNICFSVVMAAWINAFDRLSGLLRVLFFIPVITPMVGNALVWQLMLKDDGVINSLLGGVGVGPVSWLGDSTWAMVSMVVMSLWQAFGYNLIVLGAALKNVPDTVIEAARIDGASGLRRFLSVTVPMISPAIFFCTVMTVIGSFKVFAQPYALTLGGPGNATNTIVLYLYRNGFSFDKMGYASALAWALFVVVMLVTALQFAGQKRLVNYDV